MMQAELSQALENKVSGTVIIQCIHFMQEQVGRRHAGDVSVTLPPPERAEARTRAQAVALAELASRLSASGDSISAESLITPSKEYPPEFWLRVMEECRDLSGDARFFFHLGARYVPEKVKTYAATWPLRPERLFQRIPMLFPDSNEWDVEAVWNAEALSQSAVVRWRSSIITALSPEVRVRWIKATCQFYQGLFSTLPTQARLGTGTTAQVNENHCVAEGAEWCEWEFTWRPRKFVYSQFLPRTRAWWLGGMLSLLILATADWQVAPVQLILTALVTVLPIAIVFFYERARRLSRAADEVARASERTERLLREQRGLSQRQFDRIERTNTELQAMNQTLEQRVAERTQQLNQRIAELAIINSVQEGLASKLDVQDIYNLVGDKIREVFDAQVVTIATFDQEQQLSILNYGIEKGKRFFNDPYPLTPGHQHLIRTRTPIFISQDWEQRMRELGFTLSIAPGTEMPKSHVIVPLTVEQMVKGSVSLQNVDHEHAFAESDVRLLQTLANSMSVALENARLFDETQRLLKETEQRAAELATVNTVSSALGSELDVRALIHLVGEQARSIFKADIVYVALLHENRELITFPYTYGEEQTDLRYGEGLTSKIIETGKPVLINRDLDRATHAIGATLVGIVSQSYLGVPILVGGAAVGVVSVQSTTQEGAFNENDQRLLGTIAAHVGSALHNAGLYKDAQEARAAAEQANRAKSTFLANMSHELRTPLNAIIGFTRIVRKKSDGVLPEKQLENLEKVLTSSEHLLGLINTVLDIAKIEAGRMDVIASNFSIGALADQCANLAAPLLKAKVRLEKQVDPALGIVHSDQDKIKQIVLNLLSNAAKFTHEGRIRLAFQKRNEQSLSISVSDSGIGISEEALGRIFEEFQQADSGTTRKYGGTGLGLAISRNLARLLGGDLTATSELGKGSTFSLTIPIHYGRKATPPSDARPDLPQPTEPQPKADSAKKRILVIDDDPNAEYFLQESLNPNEFAVIGAPNGHLGLQLARDGQPDAILLDILMPETDGWQVLNDLKTDATTMDIPVILLTIVDKKALGFKLGAAAYLLKPLNPTLVLEALRRVIGEQEHPHKRVLVVDDDPQVAEMLRQMLSESDFRLDAAEDGEAGLQAIEAQRPDVILLDLVMPKLDGFGVIERLRADPDLRNVPIIVISAKELTEAESRMLKESVAFVMKKQGFDGDMLMQEIQSVMQK